MSIRIAFGLPLSIFPCLPYNSAEKYNAEHFLIMLEDCGDMFTNNAPVVQ